MSFVCPDVRYGMIRIKTHHKIMENKLQQLTEKLYKEGLSKGRAEAEAILAKAHADAEKIVAEAQDKAKTIVAKAEKRGRAAQSQFGERSTVGRGAAQERAAPAGGDDGADGSALAQSERCLARRLLYQRAGGGRRTVDRSRKRPAGGVARKPGARNWSRR